MYSLDRFEDEKAVLINKHGKSTIIDKALLPKEAKEGDMVYKQDDKYIIDADYTQKRRDIISEKLNKLYNK